MGYDIRTLSIYVPSFAFSFVAVYIGYIMHPPGLHTWFHLLVVFVRTME